MPFLRLALAEDHSSTYDVIRHAFRFCMKNKARSSISLFY